MGGPDPTGQGDCQDMSGVYSHVLGSSLTVGRGVACSGLRKLSKRLRGII